LIKGSRYRADWFSEYGDRGTKTALDNTGVGVLNLAAPKGANVYTASTLGTTTCGAIR
jgi:hypothetical protein